MSTFQRGDKNIANASGQVVREDIEDTLKSTAANNFGPLDGAGKILPAEFVADNNTSPKRLLIRATSGGDEARQLDENGDPNSNAATFYEVGKLDQANLGLLPKSGGTMTGSLQLTAGSQAAPSLNFGDVQTGLYKFSTNNIGLTANNTLVSTIHSSGITIATGKCLYLNNTANNKSVCLKASDLTNLPANSSLTFTMPDSTGTDGQVLQTNGSGVLSFATFGSVPTGAIFCMAENVIPDGYLECNGQQLDKTLAVNDPLFQVIQYKYGGSGNSFNVPDLRGEFIRGWASNTTDSTRDQGRGIGSGQSSDITSHAHTISNTSITVSGADHSHQIRQVRRVGTGSSAAQQLVEGNDSAQRINLDHGQIYHIGYHKTDAYIALANTPVKSSGDLSMSGTVGITIDATGGSETRPRNVALMYIIKR